MSAFASIEPISPPLSEPPKYAWAEISPEGVLQIFAATETKQYMLMDSSGEWQPSGEESEREAR